MPKYTASLFATCVLVAGIYAAILLSGSNGERLPPVGRLKDYLPSSIPGVQVEDIPLGPTESVDGRARDILDYDDVVHRSYVTPSGGFTVYIAYWARGKRTPAHISAHIPDRCWTMNGMVCLERISDFTFSSGGLQLAPGYWRRFRDPDGHDLETVFWHVVGAEFYDYGTQLHDRIPAVQRVAKVLHDLVLWRQDQYFVRIVAREPMQSLTNGPAFPIVFEKLRRLGLSAR